MMIPNLDQYLGQWALEETRMNALQALVNDRVWLREHIATTAPKRSENDDVVPPYTVDGGIARMSISGFMTKKGSSLSNYVGNVALQKMLRRARVDGAVGGVLLHVESGGGSVVGVDELATELRELAAIKPVVAYIEDIGASGAYYVASGADRIFANRSADVGSIGVYGVVYDQSKAAEDAGIVVHVIRAGQFKGMGTPGTKITDEQLSQFQRGVDATNELFVQAIAEGRGIGMVAARKLNDGRVHKGQAAIDEGFVDQLGTEADAAAWLRSQIVRGGPTRVARATKVAAGAAEKESDMSATGTEPNAASSTTATAPAVSTPRVATLEELQSNFPNAGNDFYVACLGKKMTLDQANAAHATKTDAEMAALRTENEKLKAESGKQKTEATKGKAASGVEPVEDGGGENASNEDAITAWNIAVDKEMSVTKDRARAVANVVRKHPEIHKAYLAAVNERKAR